MKYLLVLFLCLLVTSAEAQYAPPYGQTISQLPPATTLTGSEFMPIDQNGITVRTTVQGVRTGGILGVANGGTGLNSLQANSILIGNGSSVIQFLSPAGLSGYCIVSNGASWIASASCGGGGGGSVTLGSAVGNTNPSATGDLTTGLYSSGTGKIDFSSGGVNVGEFSSTGLTLPTPLAQSQGGTGASTLGANNSSGYYNNNGVLAPLTLNGSSAVNQFFTAANELYLITQGMNNDPRYYGASCNTQYADGRSPNFGLVSTTSGSPVISISGYTFKSGTACALGSCNGDVGKVISFGHTTNPTTYIASVNTGNNTATVGENMLSTTSTAYAVWGGAPTNPSDPSTAVDDTTYIHNSSFSSAIFHGGRVSLPNNCLVHGLTLANGTELVGNNGGNYYGYTTPLSATNLYVLGNGYYTDSPIGIDMTSAKSVRLRDFTLQCNASVDVMPFETGWTLAGIGIANGGQLAADAILLDHITVAYCPVAVGMPFGFNGLGTYGTYSATVSGNSSFTASISGTTLTMTALASGQPAVGSPISGTGVTSGTVITSVPSAGGTGTYTVNKSQTVSSETMTVPVNEVMSGQSHNCEFVNNGFGFNGDFSDWASDGDVFTSEFMYGMYIGPSTSSSATSANRISNGRFEEIAQNGFSAIALDGSSDDQITGEQFQFNNQYALQLLHGSGDIQVTGGMFEGNGTSNSSAAKAHIDISGNGTNLSVVGTQFLKPNFSAGGNTNYIFHTTSGSNFDYLTLEGGDVRGGFNTAVTSYEGNTPTHYKQYAPGISVIDTTQSTLNINTSGQIGIGTSGAQAGLALDMLSNTSASNSSLGLPGGSTANRPSTGIAGMLRYNSSTPGIEAFYSNQWNTLLTAFVPPVPNMTLSGLTLANDLVTPNTIINIYPGSAASDDNLYLMAISNEFTKTTGSWAVGSGNGCLDTGSVAASTWYYVFLIERIDTNVVDVLCSASVTSPTLPTNYTEKRFIGPFETDGSAHVISFNQKGDNFLWTTPTLDMSSVAIGTTVAAETLNVPPGVHVVPLGSYTVVNPGNSILWSSPITTPGAPTTTVPFSAVPGFSAVNIGTSSGTINTNLPYLVTNTSAQVNVQATAASTTTSEITNGYYLDRTQRVPLSPSINISFLNGSLPSGVTLTRASTGWYFNSSGNLTSASTNVARFDYGTPGSVSLVGLLTEGASTNYALYSRDLTQSSTWLATNVTPLLDQTGIDGAATSASSLTATSNNGTACQIITLASSNVITSLYMKRVTGSGTISVSQNGGSTYTTTVLTSSWQRFALAPATITNPQICIQLATSGNEIAVDVVQLESNADHAFVSSPIITTTATVARAADVVKITSLPWFNPNGGTFVYRFEQASSSNFSGNDFSFNGSYAIGVNNGNLSIAGSANINFTGLYNTDAYAGVSYSSPGGVFTTVLNGVSKGTGGSLAATPTSVNFGGALYSWARSFEYWPYPVTTATLQTLAP